VNRALRHSAAHVFVESLASPALDPEDDHHLRRVLRLRSTDTITVSDGVGGWATGRLGDHGRVELLGEQICEPAPRAVMIATAIPKGDRPEWIVQKLTELGISTIQFVHCARGVVTWDGARAERQLERLRRVARGAAMQSRRVWLPHVAPVARFADLVGGRIHPGMVLADPEGPPLDRAADAVVIGPEGGFDAGELSCGLPLASVAPQVLRVETAAIAAAVLLTRSG
jgi:16S rRNA (uracil1498-N3)-methyltransferase